MKPSTNPFTISEIGEPGSLVAVADFTCPKCSKHSRFFAHHQGDDGSFVCTHCELVINIRGTRLSDYQDQLDAINESLGDMTANVIDRVKKASQRLGETVEGPSDNPSDGGHKHGPGCSPGCGHVH